MGTLSFCDSTSWYEILAALSITYTPICLYALKITRGAMYGILNVLIFVNCFWCFAYLMYSHNGNDNTVAFSLGAVCSLIWGFYSIYTFVLWLIVRCRLCCLGRKYILAPPSHVDTSEGKQRLTTSNNTAFVVRKPGSTLINGQLVPSFKSLVIGGRKAVSKGAVNLLKYATK